MERQQRPVKITQVITSSGGEQEIFEHETQGIYFSMRKFHKFLYRDQEDFPIEIKCYPGTSRSLPTIELNQKYGRLRFILSEVTHNEYHVDQVQTQLDVLTKDIIIEGGAQLKALRFAYQILQQEIPIGHYEYQLIFLDEEGKI